MTIEDATRRWVAAENRRRSLSFQLAAAETEEAKLREAVRVLTEREMQREEAEKAKGER